MKRKGLWIALVAILVVVIGVVLWQQRQPAKQVQKVIKIGAILPLTGPGGVFAEYIKEGIDLAVNEINANNLFKIKIIYEDSKNQPKEALSIYNKLINIEKPPVVIVALSSVAKALAPLASETKTVQIGIAVAIPGITDISDYVFRIYPEAHGMAGVMAEYDAKYLKANSAGVIYVNDDFGISSYNVFKKVFESFGGKIVYAENYELMQNDFRNELLKLKKISPDVIYLNGYGLAYANIVKQLKEIGVKSQLTADMTLGLPITIKQAGDAAEGAYFVDGEMQDFFIKKFEERYQKEPTSYAGYAYDIIKLLSLAVKNNHGEVSSDNIKKYLLQVDNYHGAMGNIKILPNGDSNLQFVVKQIRDGKPAVIKKINKYK